MCSLFGLIDYENAVPSFARKVIVKILAQECEARGTDATGIAYNTHGSLRVYKRPVRAAKFKFNLPSDSRVIMGHTRMTTKGNQKVNNNNHPFYGSVPDNVFALAHNGVLYNDEQLRSQMQLPNTTIETDSYVAVQLIERIGHISFESLKEMSETVNGSFCFSVLTYENDVYLVKGSNPLAIYDCGGFYVYASTKEILDKALKRLHIRKKSEVQSSQGDILKISANGSVERSTFNCFDYEYSRYSFLSSYIGRDRDDADELDLIIQYASYFGIDERDIIMLSDMGYDACDIEEMLYDPVGMQTVINEYRDLMVCDIG